MAVFATVLALAACGTQIEDDPSLSVGPTVPTEDGASGTGDADESDPTATPPAATGTATDDEPTSADPGGETGTGTSGTGEGSGTAGTAPAEAPSTTEEPPGEAGSEGAPDALPAFAAPTEVRAQDAAGPAALLVDDVRVGLQDGFDRVVLDLSGTGEVGWNVQYVPDPALDGSGFPVDLAGAAVLGVTAQGMAYPEPGDPAYDDGVVVVDGGELLAVTEVLRGPPFEGQVQVFVGTETEAPFRVFRLSGPERLVIDVQHAG
ncbi:AMIN-like domain-containing (lipo)protein [Ornithinimicrobium cavernae]|uniref:AMIN-like domain-containing (lipo)protein n=1 Tax=Ornithinimicrobium cavernae TaxID=2666047 RepID=UPI000D689340|nr:hypothetical protein [Ornithinimicrobium cavernae]